ncbi:limbic system-associated membrane protein-like, partial [Lingula anatina]
VDWVREPRSAGDPASLIARGSSVLAFDKRYKVLTLPHSAFSILIIKKVNQKDVAKYRCSLSQRRLKHRYIFLNVTATQIQVDRSPAENKVNAGSNLTMYCRATGYPRPLVYWTGRLKDGTPYKFSDGRQEKFGDTLTLENLNPRDTGTFTCHVENFVEPIERKHFTVTVRDLPWYLHSYLQGFNIRHFLSSWTPKPGFGEAVMLRCETAGIPKPKLTWYKDGKPVRETYELSIFTYTPSYRPNYVNSRIDIKNFGPHHQGKYTCMSSNEMGSMEKSMTLMGKKDVVGGNQLPQVLLSDFPTDDEDIVRGLKKTNNNKQDGAPDEDDDEGSGMDTGRNSSSNAQRKFDSKPSFPITRDPNSDRRPFYRGDRRLSWRTSRARQYRGRVPQNVRHYNSRRWGVRTSGNWRKSGRSSQTQTNSRRP